MKAFVMHLFHFDSVGNNAQNAQKGLVGSLEASCRACPVAHPEMCPLPSARVAAESVHPRHLSLDAMTV